MNARIETPFDGKQLRLTGLNAWLAKKMGNPSQRTLGVMRTLFPIAWAPAFRSFLPGIPMPWPPFWRFVTRYDDVVEVLTHHEVFNVPWAEETKLLNDGKPGGTNFILGLDGDEEYHRQLSLVMKFFQRHDVANIVVPAACNAAEEILDNCGGTVDAIQDLITEVPLRICEQYYGLFIPPGEVRKQFTLGTIAMSGYLFGPPFARAAVHDNVLAGAQIARAVVQQSIDQEIADAKQEPPRSLKDTVLARLARAHVTRSVEISDGLMRAFMMGMVTGFVPTNTIAGGHILEMLLTRQEFFDAARAAARSGDDHLLSRCLFEAMRFKPLNPGPWRICAQDYVLARGTRRAKKIRKGTLVLASTQSAMFDPRRVHDPHRFDPGRPASDYMLFGHGLHWCAGKYIADAQITQTFKALLLKRNLRRAAGEAGTLRLLGLFPEHLTVQFDV